MSVPDRPRRITPGSPPAYPRRLPADCAASFSRARRVLPRWPVPRAFGGAVSVALVEPDSALERRSGVERDARAVSLAQFGFSGRQQLLGESASLPRGKDGHAAEMALIAIRVLNSETSSTMCVERSTTLFCPSSLKRLRKRTRSAGSSPAVGSSTIISFGLPRSATVGVWAVVFGGNLAFRYRRGLGREPRTAA